MGGVGQSRVGDLLSKVNEVGVFRHAKGVVLWVPALTVSNLADVLVRCTGLLQGEDE